MFELVAEQTRYCAAMDRNNKLLSYSGLLLVNRIIWLGVTIKFFAAAFSLVSVAISSAWSREHDGNWLYWALKYLGEIRVRPMLSWCG